MRISGFILPFGGKLSADNRCLNLAGMMPWEMVEEVYAGKFKKGEAGRQKPKQPLLCSP